MLPAPFYSELPTELGDDAAWCAQAHAEPDAPAPARPAGSAAWLKAWMTQSTDTLSRALSCFAWGYSTWS